METTMSMICIECLIIILTEQDISMNMEDYEYLPPLEWKSKKTEGGGEDFIDSVDKVLALKDKSMLPFSWLEYEDDQLMREFQNHRLCPSTR